MLWCYGTMLGSTQMVFSSFISHGPWLVGEVAQYEIVLGLGLRIRGPRTTLGNLHPSSIRFNTFGSETTLNYWKMVRKRYPNLNEEVGGLIPGHETSSPLDRFLPGGRLPYVL